MMKFLIGLISVKIVFLSAVGVFIFSNYQDSRVNSQNEIIVSPMSKDKMYKNMKSLEDLKWKNRIILVREEDDKGLQQLLDSKDKITERDIIWFRSNGEKIETNYDGELPEDFTETLEKDYFKKYESNTLLIGKDGTVKSKDEKLNLKNYFGQIDSMPMRQREMKEN